MDNQKTKFTQRKLWDKVPVLSIIGLFIGILGGYLYYYFIGCNSDGSCPITSNPNMSMLWGAIIGYLLFDLFVPSNKKEENKNNSGS